jgi:hypothetical protein
VLAPNVTLETPFAGRIARAKYAVVSLDQFERGTARWFHPYLWGRFAQPCGLLFAADDTVHERVVRALSAAVVHFARKTLPRLPAEFDAETLWTSGLMLTLARSSAPSVPPGSRRSTPRRQRVAGAHTGACRQPRLGAHCSGPLSQSEHSCDRRTSAWGWPLAACKERS